MTAWRTPTWERGYRLRKLEGEAEGARARITLLGEQLDVATGALAAAEAARGAAAYAHCREMLQLEASLESKVRVCFAARHTQ